MKLTSSPNDLHDPNLYLRLGELVASAGEAHFAERMLTFVNSRVAIHGLDTAEWTLAPHQPAALQIKSLGLTGPQSAVTDAQDVPRPLLHSVIRMEAPLLIQLRADQGGHHPQGSVHQCYVVSRLGDLRWVIGFHRQASLRAFSLAELSLLKTLSDTLLPLVQHHAQLIGATGAPATLADPDGGVLHQTFNGKLAHDAVSLSAREQEVCIGLLKGVTVAQMAVRLNVKHSSVETYLKRATAKLGVSGRHGLARWMANA